MRKEPWTEETWKFVACAKRKQSSGKLENIARVRYPSILLCLSLLLNGCYDRTYKIVVKLEDGSPIRCPEGQKTEFRFVTPSEVEGKTVGVIDEVTQIPEGSKKDISVGLIRGSIESGMHPWLQFSVYCGEVKALVYESPKLNENDFVKNKDGSVYTYFVKKDAFRFPRNP